MDTVADAYATGANAYTGESRFDAEEVGTYGFLLEPMLEEVGFEILESTYVRGFYADYTCRWRGAPG